MNPRYPVQPTPAANSSRSIPQLAAAIKETAAQADRETDSAARAGLADAASRDADACLRLDERAAACQYGRALALGLQARAHPTKAAQSLGGMLQALAAAESADARYDSGGPLRVRALVLIRAPGWPLGPGDVDAGLDAARRAVELVPDFPPNQLALAEAQAKTGDADGSRQSYARARDLAARLPPSPDRDDWLNEASRGMQHR